MAVTGIVFASSSAVSRAVAVPAVVGKTQENAQQTLEILGLKANLVTVEALGREGVVYAQDPMSPKVVTRGATVKLFIIKNPAQVPDWTERFTMLDEAIAAVQTEDAAEERHKEVLTQLEEIRDALGSTGTAKSTASAKSAS